MKTRFIGATLALAGVAFATSGLGTACSSDSSETPPPGAGGAGAGGSGAGGAAGEDSGLPLDCKTSDEGAETATCGEIEQTDKATREDAIYSVSYVYADESREKSCRGADGGCTETSEAACLAAGCTWGGTKDRDNVWKYYGFDIDGASTTGATAEHCTPVEGADPDSVKTDGDGGIDNGFLKNVAPIIATPSPDWVDRWNVGIDKGGSTIAVRLPDLTLPAAGTDGPPGDGSKLKGLGYTTVKLCTQLTPPEGGPELLHLLPVDRSSLCNGNLDTPLWQAPDGTFDGDVWTSGLLEEVFIVVPFNDASLRVHLKQAHMQFTLSKDRRQITLGNVGGVVNTDDLIKQLTDIRGSITPIACALPPAFDAYMKRVRQASDIMTDGKQKKGVTCDAISLGLGFDAHLAKFGPVIQLPPLPPTCDGG